MPNLVSFSHRIITSLILSVAGGATAIAMFAGLRGIGSPLLLGDEGKVIAVAFVGAFLAGVVTADAFGRPGWPGWGIAVVGAVVATLIGAQLGGTLLFGSFEEGAYCVFVLATSIGSFPVTGIAWVALMAAVHGLTLVFVPKISARFDLVPGPDNF